jgi:hypothetical protein
VQKNLLWTNLELRETALPTLKIRQGQEMNWKKQEKYSLQESLLN